MSQPPTNDKQWMLRRRPRAPSAGLPTLNTSSATSSTRPSSRPRYELTENVPTLSPTVSPPALPMRERSTNTPSPQPPSATSWQIPSCSRCHVCGKLGCVTCSVRVDPAVTRQKLDHLRLNTPYERAKLSRCIGELLSEESQLRSRLEGQWETRLGGLQATELVERHLVRIALQEACCRQQLCKSEQSMRRACVAAAEQFNVVLALQSSEAAARQALVAREKEQITLLAWGMDQSTRLMELVQRETATRGCMCYNEASQWHRLQTAAAESRRLLSEHEMARERFCHAFAESYDAICRERASGLESLAAAAVAHREMIALHVQQRGALLRAAEQSKRDLVAEEVATRQRIREEMTEAADYIDERLRMFARQRHTCASNEAAQRQRIYAEAEQRYHAIFLDMRADEEKAREVEALKADRRHAALLFALETLCTIQCEEHAAFEMLLQSARADVAGRKAWAAAKLTAQAALMAQCVRERDVVVATAEAAERAALARALAEGEVGVAQWVAAKQRVREEACRAALAAIEAVAAEERDARFRLLADMASEEERVVQWGEAKRAAVVAFLNAEPTQRAFIQQQEEVCRQAVSSSFVRTKRALADCLEQQRETRAKAVASAVAALTGVAAEEHDAWLQLRQRAADDAHQARAMQLFRGQVELLHAETQHRALLAQDEVTARTAVQTKAALSARYAAEAALAALRVQLCGVATAEDGARQYFYEQVDDWYNGVYAQMRAEELALIVQMEQRISEELRARQTYMTEDARLYTEEEPLSRDGGCGGNANFASGRSSSSGVYGGMHDVRKALVLQTLGNPPCTTTTLPAAAIDFLAAVIDRAGQRRDAAQEACAAAERHARDAAKKLAECERLFIAEKEKKEMYETSSRREAEERERRIAGEGQDKVRSQQSIAAEKRRLADVQAELLDQQKTLDALKQSINKQYNR